MIYRMVNGQRVPRCAVVNETWGLPCVLDADHDGEHITVGGMTWPPVPPQLDAVSELLDTWSNLAERVAVALEKTISAWQRVFER